MAAHESRHVCGRGVGLTAKAFARFALCRDGVTGPNVKETVRERGRERGKGARRKAAITHSGRTYGVLRGRSCWLAR